MASASAIIQGFKNFIDHKSSFEDFAIELFQYQAEHNPIYKSYLDLLKTDVRKIKLSADIPCLPISFFKGHQVQVSGIESEGIFTSSSTTSQIPSKHYVFSIDHYKSNATRIFENELGNLKDKIIIGFLPSYLERSGSSLVSMVDHFIYKTQNELSGFHLHDYDALVNTVRKANTSNQDVVIFAVRYALLDLAEKYNLDLEQVTIIETGGMKGKRGPVSNEELRELVSTRLRPRRLISEYGMTELLSQAYSDDDFIFTSSGSMRVKTMEINDPFSHKEEGRSGQLHIIDLANLFSCAFIATDDLGVVLDQNRFKILGRLDHSEQRGCNLLVSDVIT